jgi:ABC-2 type transport system ATP-binding protein
VAVIDVRGLVRRHGRITAVDGLDLQVAEGETLALLGPNGAGKTTTVECCEGYLAPHAGTVRVLGLDPIADARELRPQVGLMLQGGGLYPHVRPEEVLHTFAAFHRDPEDPDRLLADLGLEHVRRSRYRQLSGGEQQRLALALALVGRPRVLFLDEPTAGLDPVARRLTWDLLRARTDGGTAILVTTHLLEEAAAVADRVAIMDRGRLVALGTPEELTAGDGGVLLRLVARDAAARDVGAAEGGALVTALAAATGAAVTARSDGRLAIDRALTPQLLEDLATFLASTGATLTSLESGGGTLEDVYLQLVGARTTLDADPEVVQ